MIYIWLSRLAAAFWLIFVAFALRVSEFEAAYVFSLLAIISLYDVRRRRAA